MCNSLILSHVDLLLIIMKNIIAAILLGAVALSSCRSVEQVTLDQLIPAEINFPEGLRSVAVINRVPVASDSIKADTVGTRLLKGNSALAAESLAKSLADGEYFDEVVISDSIIAMDAANGNDGMLTKTQTAALTSMLNVDFLIAVEDVSVTLSRNFQAIPDWNCFRGVVDAKVYPTVLVYIPQRDKPLCTVAASDSIFWEEFGYTLTEVDKKLIGTSKALNEASEFAGTIPTKYLLPHWENITFKLYSGGSVAMRDAMTYVRCGDWDKAYKLWKDDYDKVKSERRKMCLAYNIAIYHAVSGDVEEGCEYAKEAQRIAYKLDKVEAKTKSPETAGSMPDFVLTSRCVDRLQKRKEQIFKLKIQMKRFDDDF